MSKSLSELLNAQRSAFLAEGYPSAEKRIERLDRAIAMLLNYEQRLVEALYDDFEGMSRLGAKRGDILGSIDVLEYTKRNLKSWMAPYSIELPEDAAKLGMRAQVRPGPLGVIGAIVPWNGPVLMSTIAIAGAFGAGNRIMIKSSEFAPHTSETLALAFSEFFSSEEALVIQGEAEVAAQFARMRFDHLLFTGSTATGRKVMQAAAENLVPVTLELGGKCPVVIGRGADLGVAAKRIALGKLASAGQVCVAPDYVYVPAGKSDAFVGMLIEAAQELYPDMVNNEEYTAVINQQNRSRICALLEDAVAQGAQVIEVPGQPPLNAAKGTRLPLVILTNVTDNMRVMQEEIFGPLLPVMEYEDFAEPLAYIAQKPHPLSASYFGADDSERMQVIERVQTGSVVVNDVRVQIFYEALPFGGVGESGIGRYRGYEGFKTFSNLKTVLHQSENEAELARRRPPFDMDAYAAVDTMLSELRAKRAAP